jgi:anti-sigma regulatory factor (Ser/Thr protein kinase)
MYADEARLSVSVATVEFRADGDRTHHVVTEQGVFLDGDDTSAQREEGTRSLLASLGAELDGTAA